MKLRLTILLIAAAVLLSGIQLFAHHSFAATYFEDKQQTIEGDLVQFMFRNPHSFIHIEGKDEKGPLTLVAASQRRGRGHMRIGSWSVPAPRRARV